MASEYPESDDLKNLLQNQQYQFNQLSLLFGAGTVEQASMIDIADLNLNEEMTASISNGITRLKQLKYKPDEQIQLVNRMSAGERLLLCMWIIEMDLLNKIQGQPYPK